MEKPDLVHLTVTCPKCTHMNEIHAVEFGHRYYVTCSACGALLGSWEELVEQYREENGA